MAHASVIVYILSEAFLSQLSLEVLADVLAGLYADGVNQHLITSGELPIQITDRCSGWIDIYPENPDPVGELIQLAAEQQAGARVVLVTDDWQLISTPGTISTVVVSHAPSAGHAAPTARFEDVPSLISVWTPPEEGARPALPLSMLPGQPVNPHPRTGWDQSARPKFPTPDE